jgi:hypothetical protein
MLEEFDSISLYVSRLYHQTKRNALNLKGYHLSSTHVTLHNTKLSRPHTFRVPMYHMYKKSQPSLNASKCNRYATPRNVVSTTTRRVPEKFVPKFCVILCVKTLLSGETIFSSSNFCNSYLARSVVPSFSIHPNSARRLMSANQSVFQWLVRDPSRSSLPI